MVECKGNYEQWIKFFLKGIITSSEDAIKSIEAITRLNEQDVQRVKDISGRNKTIIKLFEYLGKNPIIDIAKTAKELGLQYNTVAKAVERLEAIGILKQVNNAKQNRYFAYDEYLKILKKDT
ncbi:MAG: winged helix-turn-helix transcriptional regulator [Thermincolia bacterium]